MQNTIFKLHLHTNPKSNEYFWNTSHFKPNTTGLLQQLSSSHHLQVFQLGFSFQDCLDVNYASCYPYLLHHQVPKSYKTTFDDFRVKYIIQKGLNSFTSQSCTSKLPTYSNTSEVKMYSAVLLVQQKRSSH